MENVRKHVDVTLVQTKKKLQKLTRKSTFKTCKIFSEDLVAVELSRAKVKLFKPSYSGMCILDISKLAMYDFYYNYLKQLYRDKLQLQMTDTDSLLFYCETENIYDDMKERLDLFDTSDYPKDHFLHSNENKKVLGKMKDEMNGKPIHYMCALRPKMYAFVCDGKEEKKAKGIAKVTVKKDLRFETYKQTLFQESKVRSSMCLIRSHSHQLFCEKIVKTGLSCFDDKRYLLDDGIESLAYGHYKIKAKERDNLLL